MKIGSKENVEAIYPLSPLQQALVFHNLSLGKSEMGFLQIRFTLQGSLDIVAFQRAWQQVIDRHPVLRTSFHWENLDSPLQVVRRHITLPWEQQDLTGLSPVEQKDRLEGFLKADRERGFNLGRAPVMRLVLIKTGKDIYEFIWSFHHVLLDGWSSFLIRKEVFTFYEAFRQGNDVQLERLRPYRDYIAWLRQQNLSRAEAFWRQTLKGFTKPTSLKGYGKVAAWTDRGQAYDERQIRLSAATTRALQALARQHQFTLNTVIQGAWALLLSRYSGEEDVLYGTVVSGRQVALEGVESMVGLFINALPVRVQIIGDVPLLAWLKGMQTEQFELRQYEYTPLAEIHEWSEVPGNLRLFESLLIFENYPFEDVSLTPSRTLKVDNLRGAITTNYPLTVVVELVPELAVQIIYDRHRFSDNEISRMLGDFRCLLEEVAVDPQRRLSDLPPFPEAEPSQNWTHPVPPAANGARPTPQRDFVAPRDPLEFQLTTIWEKVLGIRPVSVNYNFFELSGHSMLALRLLAQIEKMAGKKLPLATLFQAPTVAQLANVLRQQDWEAPWSSLVPIQPAGSNPPLFCVHALAGNVLFYNDLARHLGPDQPLYGLQARGLDGDHDPSTQLEEMASHYIKEIRTVQPEGPYLLAGLSLGGTLAYEMAQQLQAQGQRVALLVLFDTWGPGYPRISLFRLIRDKTRRAAERIYNNARRFTGLELKEQASFALEKAQNVKRKTKVRNRKRIRRLKEKIQTVICNLYIATGRPLPPSLRHLRVREADREAHGGYTPKAYSGRVTLFRASRQPWGCYPDPTLGWGPLVNGNLEIHEIRGSHSHALIREPLVQAVVEKLKPCLEKVQAMEVNQ